MYKLTIVLKNNKNYGFEISSLLHGVIMENVSKEYADELHESGLKPYSQYVERIDDNVSWVITALNKRAKENILDSLMELNEVYLKYKNDKLEILDKQLEINNYKAFLKNTYFSACARKVEIRFVSPTAFKSGGKYHFYPTVEHIFKSLISKHDAMNENTEIYSEKLLLSIKENVEISNYKLRSTNFFLEGRRIKSFMGNIVITVRGTQQFVNLINMLCEFGEYSGIGIKTAIGMGAVHVKQISRKER